MEKDIPTAILGRTGLKVTRLGFGAGFRNSIDAKQADILLNAILDSGINYIDTSNDYRNSEELIGSSIAHRRSEFWLATKCGCSPDGHIWTRENLFRGLHESLKRLKVEYVDVMQLHNPTVQQFEEGNLAEALQEMQRKGKVRWIGISTTLPYLPTFLEIDIFDVFQIPYSALERDHESWISTVAEVGIGVVNRGGVAIGEPGVGLGKEELWGRFWKAGLDELREQGESRTAFMLRYTLSHPHTHTIIVGTSNLEHMRENVETVLKGPLPSTVYAEATQRLSAATP